MRDLILEHIGTFGWDGCAFTEEILSSKFFYPNMSYPAKDRAWSTRLKSSDASMMSFIKRVDNVHAEGQRMDLASMEQLSVRAALLHACVQEVKLAVPIPEGKLEKEWIARWEKGDLSLDQELQVACFGLGVYVCMHRLVHYRMICIIV